MKVAIVHDYLTQRGGAERVVASMHRIFPDAPIYTSVYLPESTYDVFSGCDVRTTFLQRLVRDGSDPRALLPLYPLAFDRLTLRGYDLVISSSSGFSHGVRTPGAVHLCYCYTPARFLYQSDRYLGPGGPLGSTGRRLVQPLLATIRRWDRKAALRPDRYIAISAAIQRRISQIYGHDSVIVHPPVDLERRLPVTESPGERLDNSDSPYFLVVARLLPYKRIDLVIEAARAIGTRLVVVGSGPALGHLRSISHSGVEFRASVSDAELSELLAGCVALVQAGEEDFGIAPLEANAAGRPVVALARGGALETVVDGKTGTLFSEQSAECLVSAMQRVTQIRFNPEVLERHVLAFSEDRFHAQLSAVCETALGSSKVNGHGVQTTARAQVEG